jgi:hypothetical protein
MDSTGWFSLGSLMFNFNFSSEENICSLVIWIILNLTNFTFFSPTEQAIQILKTSPGIGIWL